MTHSKGEVRLHNGSELLPLPSPAERPPGQAQIATLQLDRVKPFAPVPLQTGLPGREVASLVGVEVEDVVLHAVGLEVALLVGEIVEEQVQR